MAVIHGNQPANAVQGAMNLIIADGVLIPYGNNPDEYVMGPIAEDWRPPVPESEKKQAVVATNSQKDQKKNRAREDKDYVTAKEVREKHCGGRFRKHGKLKRFIDKHGIRSHRPDGQNSLRVHLNDVLAAIKSEDPAGGTGPGEDRPPAPIDREAMEIVACEVYERGDVKEKIREGNEEAAPRRRIAKPISKPISEIDLNESIAQILRVQDIKTTDDLAGLSAKDLRDFVLNTGQIRAALGGTIGILSGSPGTGKTYTAAVLALRIATPTPAGTIDAILDTLRAI